MKKLMKRTLAVALTMAMCAGSMNLTALAADVKVLKCDTPEHIHTSDCYAEAPVLVCDLEETETKLKEVTKTVTETVVDEETGEETEVTKEVTDYEVVPGHTHGPECYEVKSEPICGLEEHTHTDACYAEETRDIVENEDGSTTVTPPSEFTAETKDEEGNTTSSAEVKVGEDGKATVTVNGQEVEATVEAEVTSKPVNTTIGEAGETTSKELSRTENEDGTITVETEYTTTYTKEVTTGYWVTYTVTYTVPTTYSVDTENSSSDVTVELGEDGKPTVTGIKDGATVTLKGDDDKEYTVSKGNDGKFYVTIGNQSYEVEATVTEDENEDGKYNVSWGFADSDTKVKYEDGKEWVDRNNMPEGVEIKDGNITLTDGTVTLGNKEFTVEGGKVYFMNGEEKCEVTLTATGDDKTGYTLSWSYEISKAPEDDGESLPTLPDNVTAVVENGKLNIKDETGKILTSTDKINGYTIQSVSTTTDGKAQVTCKDSDGNVYIYAVKAPTVSTEGNGYDVEYELVQTLTTEGINTDGKTDAINKATNNNKQNVEFIALALPDGTSLVLGSGTSSEWLVGGDATDVNVTVSKNTITVTYGGNSNNGGHNKPGSSSTSTKTFELDLPEGFELAEIVWDDTSGHLSNDKYDYIIIYVAGVVIKNTETGEVKTLTLTVSDETGEIEVTKEKIEGSIGTGDPGDDKLGGQTEQTKYVTVSSLSGSAVVVVKTEGGNQVTMTYSEYLEAKDKGEDMTLVGVLESSVKDTAEAPEETEDPEEEETETPDETPSGTTGGTPGGTPGGTTGGPVIPVIPDSEIEDEDVPLTELPEDLEEIEEEAVPLTELPEDLEEIEEDTVPLSELPEDLEDIEDDTVPLSELPEIEDDTVPLSELPEIEDDTVPLTELPEIEDSTVPLGDVPQTGDNSLIWSVLTAISGMGLAWLALDKKRKGAEE